MNVHPTAAMMPLLPDWSIPPWVMVLFAVIGLHVAHARSARGQLRWWHAAHVFMGAGMIVMFLVPHHGFQALYWALTAGYCAHAVAMAFRIDRVVDVGRGLWVAAVVDQLVMAYMVLPLQTRPAALTYPAVAYLAAAAVVWFWVPVRSLGALRQQNVPAAAGFGAASRHVAGTRDAAAHPEVYRSEDAAARATAPETAAGLTSSVRLTLAAMALVMALMLLAMQPMGGSMPQNHHDMGSMTSRH